MANISIERLPENVKEGDVLIYRNNIYELDNEKKAEIEERINEKLKDLFSD